MFEEYEVTILTPTHIGSGEEVELNYNFLADKESVYIYDEFKIGEFLLSQNQNIDGNFESIKEKISRFSEKILKEVKFKRKVERYLKIDKSLFLNISSNNTPIIAGSSIKGAIRTAFLNMELSKDEKLLKEIEKKLDEIYELSSDTDFSNKKRNQFKIKKLQKEVDDLINSKFVKDKDKDKDKDYKVVDDIFKYLKVSDSLEPLATKVYKSINIKKLQKHQERRDFEEYSQYIETLKPKERSKIYINKSDKTEEFDDLVKFCNEYYLPLLEKDINESEFYFTNSKVDSAVLDKLRDKDNRDIFILNIGRFSGAEIKSIEDIRYLVNSKHHEYPTSETSTRTFGIDRGAKDSRYFRGELSPFGWVLLRKL